jgi:hypothetical protein
MTLPTQAAPAAATPSPTTIEEYGTTFDAGVMLVFGVLGFLVVLGVLLLIGVSARRARRRDKEQGRTGGRIGTQA